MVAYKREKFVHRPLDSQERKYRGENIILCGSILVAGGKKLREEGHGVGRRKS